VGGEKNLRNLQGKFASAHPHAEQESILGHLLGSGDKLGRVSQSGSFSSFSVCFEGDD